jgi:integrase
MKAKKPLTDRAIQGLKPAPTGKRHLVWDAQVPGLAVRVTDQGKKTFVLCVRYPGSGNPAPRSLGAYGAITLEAARDKARDWHSLIRSGTDPKTHEAARRADTLQAICEEYLKREGKRLRSADLQRRLLERLVYPVLGSRPIDSIKRTDIIRLLDQIEDNNGAPTAHVVLAFVRRIMNWHASRSDQFRSPIVRGMSRIKPNEHARSRVLTDDELRAIWQKASGPFGSLVRFILLTSARRSEAAGMTWAEISEGDWTLPAARNKTKVDLVRPLSKAALSVLPPKIGDYVFANGRGPMGSISKLKLALDKASGVNGYTLHDCRRTARSLMSRAGIDADIAERCLGHVIPGIRSVYDRHEYYREKEQAFEALAALMDRIINGGAEVVSIGKGRG